MEVYKIKEFKFKKLIIAFLKIKKFIKKIIVNYWLKIILVNIETYYEGPISVKIFSVCNEPSLIGNIVRTIYTFSPIFLIDTYFAYKRKEKLRKEHEKYLENLKKTRKVIDGKLYFN